ncbi:transposon Tf2-9 polyprotein [Nephila pilipes]|uniref:Transposon Tf2-9 polyprotein n=1 Tax=Nephila pilipes TaxID=299642 RepID=A0A8X6U1A8_NEPPI|nr:transposon Tf2-9 polyprotein [Nephila pilipes]
MNVPQNELDVYIDSVTVNETKCEMIICTDSIDKNIEMVNETIWYKNITLDVNHKCFDVNFKLDTDAEVNILHLYILNMFKVKPKLSETNFSLTTYGNFKLKPDDSVLINCSTNKLKNVPLLFYVVNVKSKPLLGLKCCKELKLIERIDVIECSIIKKVGIVSKVNEPTDWVKNLVIVEKPNGSMRLCLDPRYLNEVIKREHYQILCTDNIISKSEVGWWQLTEACRPHILRQSLTYPCYPCDSYDSCS